jgi:hypothetical protein
VPERYGPAIRMMRGLGSVMSAPVTHNNQTR